MIKWFKRDQKETPTETDTNQAVIVEQVPELLPEEQQIEPSKEGLFARFKRGLSKTRQHLGDGIGRLLLGKKEINQELLDELETLLISADVGMETTQAILKELTEGLARKQLADGEAVYDALKKHLSDLLGKHSQELTLTTADNGPFVILMVGVNGAGKTTTIGKLAKQLQQQGKKSHVSGWRYFSCRCGRTITSMGRTQPYSCYCATYWR